MHHINSSYLEVCLALTQGVGMGERLLLDWPSSDPLHNSLQQHISSGYCIKHVVDIVTTSR